MVIPFQQTSYAGMLALLSSIGSHSRISSVIANYITRIGHVPSLPGSDPTIAYRMSIASKRDQRAATQPALGSPLDLDDALAMRNCVGYLQS